MAGTCGCLTFLWSADYWFSGPSAIGQTHSDLNIIGLKARVTSVESFRRKKCARK